MKFLEHKIPPPAVGLGIGFLMWYLASLVPPVLASVGVVPARARLISPPVFASASAPCVRA